MPASTKIQLATHSIPTLYAGGKPYWDADAVVKVIGNLVAEHRRIVKRLKRRARRAG